jgi:integrase
MKGCRPLTEQEICLITDSFDRNYQFRDKALFLLGIKAGFRITEILSLVVEDIYQNSKILAAVTVKRRNMKGKLSSRTVVLHEAVKLAVQDWLRFSGLKTGPLFRSRQGGKNISRVQAWRILNTTFKQNEVVFHTGTHCMRKTFASNIYTKLDKDLVKTCRALGHKNIMSTISYLSFDDEEINRAILS